MITGSPLGAQPAHWQRELAQGYCDPRALLAALGLSARQCGLSLAAHARFRTRVPRGFVARMRPGDPHDPLLRQVLPLTEEEHQVEGYGADPVGDLAAQRSPGLLHKYRGRVLLVTTGACAVHCRYCFRREYPYAESSVGGAQWQAALEYLASDPSVNEVLLSGGDPLSLPDGKLAAMVADLERIAHLRRLRLHTRLPVVLPERVDEGLLGWLAGGRLARVVVIHANHPAEIDAAVLRALRTLGASGCTLLNQSVLLRGVNEEVRVLAELSERLFSGGVLPYYLHQLDPVQGAAHFAVDDARALALHAALRAQLPGYLVPRLVFEAPGADAKREVLERAPPAG